MRPRLHLLIKFFSQEEYADAFLNHGEMYCQTLGSFKKMESDTTRGDTHEGVGSWHQPGAVTSLTVTFTDQSGMQQTVDLKPNLVGPFSAGQRVLERLNLFCMYAVKTLDVEEPVGSDVDIQEAYDQQHRSLIEQARVPEVVHAFGEYAVVVFRIEDFLNRVHEATEALDIQFRADLVTYYDPKSFSGDFDELDAAFHKQDQYRYQSEYRFAFVHEKDAGPMTMKLGALRDIAFKVPTRDINTCFQIGMRRYDDGNS